MASRTVNSPYITRFHVPNGSQRQLGPSAARGGAAAAAAARPETLAPLMAFPSAELMPSAGPLLAPGSPAPPCPINFKCYSYPLSPPPLALRL